jgi:hypothetical protein
VLRGEKLRKYISALIAAIVLMVSMVMPAAAADCDPGRPNDGTNGYVTSFTTTILGVHNDSVHGQVQVDRPFLESGQWVNSYVELSNGSNYVRLGVQYREGVATRRYVSGSFFQTQYLAMGSTDFAINTWEAGSTRWWQFTAGGVSVIPNVPQTSGRWTPDRSSAWTYTSSGGNSVPGEVGLEADVYNLTYSRTDSTSQVSFGGVDKAVNWPAGYGSTTSGFYTYETDC